MPKPLEPEFFVPARWVLRDLHRRGSEPAVAEPPAEPVDGWTVCGKPMLLSESWVGIDRRESDLICRGCEVPGGVLASVEDVEVTLW